MKKWFYAALVILIVGLVLVGAEYKKDGFERFIISEDEFEKDEYVCEDDVRDIYIDDSSQHIEIIPSDDGKCRLEYSQTEYDVYEISLKNGVLRVKRDEKFSILRIQNFGERVMRLYLPEGEYGKLKVDAASSNVIVNKGFGFTEIDIELASGDAKCFADAGNMSIDTASGEVTVADAEFDRVEIETASGEVMLKDMVVRNKIEIDTASGDVEFDGLDAGYIHIDTASGDVDGSVAKAMMYETDTASGDVSVPVSMKDAAVCRVETASGDITIIEK